MSSARDRQATERLVEHHLCYIKVSTL
jgi:hypothetical protein